MATERTSPDGSVITISRPLFLVTLARCQKSQRIFTLTNLRIIVIRVETYKTQAVPHTGIQLPAFRSHLGPLQAGPKMSLVRGWPLPPRIPWKGITIQPTEASLASQPPRNYRGCSCDKKELQRRKLHNSGPQAPSSGHYTYKTISSGKSYAATAANLVLETPPADTHHQKNTAEQAADRCTDWRRYGYINHHSPADPDRSTDSRHWRGQVCSHYEDSLWTDYAKITVTNSHIRPCSTVSTPILVWSLFPSGRR